MSRQVTETVYQFSELSDSAKEKAREWYREGALDYGWHEYTIQDATDIAALFGLDIDTRHVKTIGGSKRYEPNIYFSGFSGQGDGLSFEGNYTYKAGALKAVKKYAPQDAELHRIVSELSKAQRPYFYQLNALTEHKGRYFDMDINVETETGDTPSTFDDVAEALKDFAHWIYKRLEAEHDYLLSDACVDENIEGNEYEFDEDGNRA